MGYQSGLPELSMIFWETENSDFENLELVSSDRTPPWKSSLSFRIMISDARLFRVEAASLTDFIDRTEVISGMGLRSELPDGLDLLSSLVGSDILGF